MSKEAIAAIDTLKFLGYTYHGGEKWKPPLGPKPDFWEGYVPEPVKPAQQCKWPTCQSEEYQQALAEQIKRELVGEQPAQQEPVAFLVDGDLYYPEEIDWETLQEQGHTVAPLYTKDQL